MAWKQVNYGVILHRYTPQLGRRWLADAGCTTCERESLSAALISGSWSSSRCSIPRDLVHESTCACRKCRLRVSVVFCRRLSLCLCFAFHNLYRHRFLAAAHSTTFADFFDNPLPGFFMITVFFSFLRFHSQFIVFDRFWTHLNDIAKTWPIGYLKIFYSPDKIR